MGYKINKPERLISFKLAKAVHNYKTINPNVTRIRSDSFYNEDGSLSKWTVFKTLVAYKFMAAYSLSDLKLYIEQKQNITFNTRNKKLEKDLIKFLKNPKHA